MFQTMLEYFGRDLAQITHASMVYIIADMIARRERLDSGTRAALGCAALLHDIGIGESLRTFESCTDGFHEFMGQKLAAEILTGLGFDQESADRITYLIGNHHTGAAQGGSALQILVEAEVLAQLMAAGEMDLQLRREAVERSIHTRAGREYAASMFAVPLGTPNHPGGAADSGPSTSP